MSLHVYKVPLLFLDGLAKKSLNFNVLSDLPVITHRDKPTSVCKIDNPFSSKCQERQVFQQQGSNEVFNKSSHQANINTSVYDKNSKNFKSQSMSCQQIFSVNDNIQSRNPNILANILTFVPNFSYCFKSNITADFANRVKKLKKKMVVFCILKAIRVSLISHFQLFGRK